jgi:fucose 4-O-acetylase-like acetyltransferase
VTELATDDPVSAAPRKREVQTAARVEAIDYAKGIGILLVVVAHVWRGLDARIFLPAALRTNGPIDRWVYGFHMPLFFAVSGLFLYRSAGKPARAYLAEKGAALLWPYLLWSAIYWALASFTGGERLSPAAFAAALVDHPIGHLWFLWVLLLVAIVILALRKLFLPAWGVLVVAIAFRYLAVMPQYAIHLKIARAIHLPIEAPLFEFAMFFPYVAGAAAIAGPLLKALQRWPLSTWVALMVAGAAIVTYETRSGNADAQMFNPVSGVAGTIMVLGVARVLEHLGVASIRFVGQRSLEIYLVHILAAAAVRVALLKAVHVTQWSIHLPAGFFAGVLAPLALWWACRVASFPVLFRLPTVRRGRS